MLHFDSAQISPVCNKEITQFCLPRTHEPYLPLVLFNKRNCIVRLLYNYAWSSVATLHQGAPGRLTCLEAATGGFVLTLLLFCGI